MEDIPRDKEPDERKVKQVTSARTVRRRRGLGHRFKETFIGGDAKSTGEYVLLEVIVPEVKDLIVDAGQRAIEHIFYGDSTAHPRARRGAPSRGPLSYEDVARVDYTRMSRSSSHPQRVSRQARARHDFRDIVITNRIEAEEVLERMYDVLSRYGSVSVADLYELTGIEGTHVDMKWGWHSLRGARLMRDGRRGGYLISLPEPEELGLR